MTVRTTGLPARCCAVLLAGGLLATLSPTPVVAVPDHTTAESGNPFVDGWYADPGTVRYGDRYWVFPTTSKVYAEQTYLDAFSSTDLVHWTKHPRVLSTPDIPWAEYALWAPAPVERDGRTSSSTTTARRTCTTAAGTTPTSSSSTRT